MPYLKKDLPLFFTLKDSEEKIILITHKKMTITLDSNNEVYFFQDNIYLPSDNQMKKYRNIYNMFLKNNKITFR